MKKFKIAFIQILVIMAVWSCAYWLQKFLKLPVASGVLSFFLLLFLLEMKWLRLAHVERGADLLLGELLLFFIPPVVGIIQYQELLIASGWKILLVIMISTALVMMVSVSAVRMFLSQDDME